MVERREQLSSRLLSTGTAPDYLTDIRTEDMDAILYLAKKAYPKKVKPRVVGSLIFHGECLQAGLDDGRRFFKREEDSQIAGVCGFQRKLEDPPGICWGTWFFIDPERKSSLLAYRMGIALLKTVKVLGYETIYVDTSSNLADYYNIAPLLSRVGFSLQGSIPNFYETGVDMQIYCLNLR